MSNANSDTLINFLRAAHSIEEQSLRQLEAAADAAGEPGLAEAFAEHLVETRRHEARICGLLEARNEKPSPVQDNVLRAGGLAFVLFAQAQRDTPGKLAAHMYAYEALESAGYTVLERFAADSGDADVASVARAIRADEDRMMGRVERLFDAAVAASLRAADDAPLDRLRVALADAHAIEAQSLELLEAGVDMAEQPTWHDLFAEHLVQTRYHIEALEHRLDALHADRSLLKDAALRIGGLSWSAFFRAQDDSLPKFAAFMYAFQHLEIAGYEQLRRIAAVVGDLGTRVVVDGILAEEQRTAVKLSAAFDEALDRVGHGDRMAAT